MSHFSDTEIVVISKLISRPPDPLTETDAYARRQRTGKRDKDLAAIFKTHGPPPMWGRTRGFSTLIKIILEQQVSLASAASLFKRLRRSVVPFTPARMIELGEITCGRRD